MLSPEEMFERPLAGEDTEKEIPHWCGNILWAIIAFLQKILYRYRVHGRENIRNLQGVSGVVIAPTHHSYLDATFIWCAVRLPQWARMMARSNLFEKNALISQILARVGAFPIARDTADRTAVKRAARMLKNKECVCIFPEGTRRGKSKTKPLLHAGAALIARMGKAPLVPACVRHAEKIKEKGKFFRFPTIHVCFGKPVEIAWFNFLPKEDRLDACIWYVMRESFAMQEECAPEDIDMQALFPEAKDFSQTFAEHPLNAE